MAVVAAREQSALAEREDRLHAPLVAAMVVGAEPEARTRIRLSVHLDELRGAEDGRTADQLPRAHAMIPRARVERRPVGGEINRRHTLSPLSAPAMAALPREGRVDVALDHIVCAAHAHPQRTTGRGDRAEARDVAHVGVVAVAWTWLG